MPFCAHPLADSSDWLYAVRLLWHFRMDALRGSGSGAGQPVVTVADAARQSDLAINGSAINASS
jgi:hypothetical protein